VCAAWFWFLPWGRVLDSGICVSCPHPSDKDNSGFIEVSELVDLLELGWKQTESCARFFDDVRCFCAVRGPVGAVGCVWGEGPLPGPP
jgi:hypothetical protein